MLPHALQQNLFLAHTPLILESFDNQFSVVLPVCDLVTGEAFLLEFGPGMCFVFARSKKFVLLHEYLGWCKHLRALLSLVSVFPKGKVSFLRPDSSEVHEVQHKEGAFFWLSLCFRNYPSRMLVFFSCLWFIYLPCCVHWCFEEKVCSQL